MEIFIYIDNSITLCTFIILMTTIIYEYKIIQLYVNFEYMISLIILSPLNKICEALKQGRK